MDNNQMEYDKNIDCNNQKREYRLDKNEIFMLILKKSLFVGGALGIVAVIPYINMLAVLLLFVFASVVVVYHFQSKRMLGELSMKGAAVMGAIVGVVASCGFLLIALPLYALLSYIPFINSSFSLVKHLWQISWLLLPMTWIIAAPLNSAALMAYVYVRDTFFMIESSKQERVFRPDFFKKED